MKIKVAQGAQGAVRANFRGPDGAFEDAGDLGEREVLKAAEEEDFAVVAGEAAEGGVEEGVVVAGGGVFAGVGRVVGMRVKRGGIGGGGPMGGLAKMVGGAAAGELIEPGGERALVAVGVPVFEDALKDRLREVFRGGALAGEMAKKTEEPAVVALEELAEGIEVAGADGEHEGVIGSGGGGVHGEAGGSVSRGRAGGNAEIGEVGDHGGTWRSVARETGPRGNGYTKSAGRRRRGAAAGAGGWR